MRWTHARGALLAAWICAAPASAQAQQASPALALAWSAPAGCPDLADVTARVSRLVDLAHAPDGGAVHARGRIVRTHRGRFRLSLALGARRPSHHRTLVGDACDAVADGAALILALAVDPSAVARRRDAEAPPATPAEAPGPSPPALPAPPVVDLPATVPVPTVPVPRATPAAAATRWMLRAGGALDVGALPAVSGGPSLALTVAHGLLRVELGAAWVAPRQGLAAAGKGGDIDLAFGSLAVGAEARTRWIDVGGLAGVEIGVLRAQGFGVTTPASASPPWVAVTLLGTLRRRLGARWNVVATVGAALPLLRPRFVLDGIGAVQQPAALGLRAHAGVEFAF